MAFQLHGQFETRHSGHHHVQDHQVDVADTSLENLFRASGSNDIITASEEIVLQDIQDVLLVIDKQKSFLAFHDANITHFDGFHKFVTGL